jgi:pimeloyl-ACP methyl ester carboxylesterase
MPLFPRVEVNAGSGKPKIVFLAGFPDNQTSGWGKTLPEHFAKDFHLIFLCLPGYEKDGTIPWWGYNFKQLIEFLHLTILDICKDEKFLLVAHDWGCYVSMLYQNKHPEQIKKLVLLDVGLLKPHTIPIVHALIITGYQIWFAVSFIVCQLLGSTIGTIFMGLYFLPFLKPIWPTTDKGNISLKEIRADKCYPYFYLWKSILTLNMISPSFPNCPTLYLVSLPSYLHILTV